jgi:hypothetical protein
MIGDSNLVGVSTQVFDNVLRITKGTLGVYYPVVFKQAVVKSLI